MDVINFILAVFAVSMILVGGYFYLRQIWVDALDIHEQHKRDKHKRLP